MGKFGPGRRRSLAATSFARLLSTTAAPCPPSTDQHQAGARSRTDSTQAPGNAWPRERFPGRSETAQSRGSAPNQSFRPPPTTGLYRLHWMTIPRTRWRNGQDLEAEITADHSASGCGISVLVIEGQPIGLSRGINDRGIRVFLLSAIPRCAGKTRFP